MKICFVSYEYPPNILGGAGTYAGFLVNGLKKMGIEITVICHGNDNYKYEDIYRVQVPDVTYWRRLFFMKSAMKLFSHLKKLNNFDIVHFNEPHLLFSKLNIPMITSIHSNQYNEAIMKLSSLKNEDSSLEIKDLFFKSIVGITCDLITSQIADKIICPSLHLANLIKTYCLVNENKINVIPNCIDTSYFDTIIDNDLDFLKKYDLNNNYLLYVGRLSFLKGIHYLLKAFKEIKKYNKKVKLVIVGTGENSIEHYLRNIAKGIKDVIFTGYIDSPIIKKTLYKNCIALIVPSIYEGLPMVILEAMTCQKPVIASDIGGISLAIKHGRNGFLIEPRSIKSIQKNIEILIEDKKLRNKMGKYSRKIIEEEFTIRKMVDNTLKVYNSFF